MIAPPKPISLSNDPGRILPILERELEDFATEATRFLEGEWEETQFIGFRLKQGVYGQRQPGVQMIRCKLPLGGVTAGPDGRLRRGRRERFAPLRKGHITTRQNFQFHHMPLEARCRTRCKILGSAGHLHARGVRQHRPQRHRRPMGGRQRRTNCSTRRPTARPLRASGCATR